eukprot:IDg15615t1
MARRAYNGGSFATKLMWKCILKRKLVLSTPVTVSTDVSMYASARWSNSCALHFPPHPFTVVEGIGIKVEALRE